MNIHDIAPGLTRDEAGFWRAPESVGTSYPIGGNDACLAMEEQSFWFAHRNRAILAAVRRHPPAGGPIFDVGAGNGYVAAALDGAGFPTIAIEPNREGAVNASGRGITHVVCGSLPSSAFLPDRAGAIGLFDVLEHIEDDRGFLESLAPYLRDGGRLYITTPAHSWLWSDNDVHSGHFRRYTRSTLGAVVRDAGYRVEYATYLFWSLPLPIFLFRRMRQANGQACARSRSQHRAGGAIARRAAEAIFAFETRRIARGASIPFGASCLMVATREPAR